MTEQSHMITKAAASFNGITIAYLMGMVNAFMGVLIAFGVPLTDQENAAIVGFVNAAMIAVIHMAHRVGEVHARQQVAATAAVVAGVAPVGSDGLKTEGPATAEGQA